MTANAPRTRRLIVLLCAVALAAFGLAACGSSDDDTTTSSNGGTSSSETTGGGGGGGGATSTLSLGANESGGLSFTKKTLTAKAGTVTIDFTNASGNQLPHAVEVEGNGVEEETETIQPGGDGSVTVDLKPGTYEFYCPVGDHRAQGMQGTLTVQ